MEWFEQGGFEMSWREKRWFFGIGICLWICGFLVALQMVKEKEVEQLPYEVKASQLEQDSTMTMKQERIAPYTKMIYRYYYLEDGITKEVEDVPPYYLLDFSREELVKTYEDWQVVSFSEKEVVLQKNMEGKSEERYVIGIKDGYVAVFYQEPKDGNNIRELTNIPIAAFPREEQERLEEGFLVYGDENLARILSDYGS